MELAQPPFITPSLSLAIPRSLFSSSTELATLCYQVGPAVSLPSRSLLRAIALAIVEWALSPLLSVGGLDCYLCAPFGWYSPVRLDLVLGAFCPLSPASGPSCLFQLFLLILGKIDGLAFQFARLPAILVGSSFCRLALAFSLSILVGYSSLAVNRWRAVVSTFLSF